MEVQHVDPEEIKDRPRQDLAGQLGRRRHLADVVDEPDPEDDGGRDYHPEGRRAALKTGAKAGSCEATAMATSIPKYIAAPPAGGRGPLVDPPVVGHHQRANGAWPARGRTKVASQVARRPQQRRRCTHGIGSSAKLPGSGEMTSGSLTRRHQAA